MPRVRPVQGLARVAQNMNRRSMTPDDATRDDAMGDDDAANAANATPRRKRTILCLLSGARAHDAKLVEFQKTRVLEPADDVFFAHFVRGASSASMYGPGGVGGDVRVKDDDDDATRSPPGVRVVPLARDDAGDDASRRVPDWLSEHARAEMLDRRISFPDALVRCVQIDSMCGKFSIEETVQAICEGEFASDHASYRNDNWISIPRPDLIVMGCRGHGLVRRALLGSVTQNVLNRIAVPTCFFRSTLPQIEVQPELVKQKLGGVDQRVVAIAMSGSNSSRRLVEYFVNVHIRPSDVVLLLHCSSESQKRQKDITDADVEENMCRAFDLVQEFQKANPHTCGRVVRMTLEPGTGSANDVRDRTIDFLNLTDVNLAVVGRATSSSHLRARFMSPFPQYLVTHAPCPVLVWNPAPVYIRSQSTTSQGGEPPSTSAA